MAPTLPALFCLFGCFFHPSLASLVVEAGSDASVGPIWSDLAWREALNETGVTLINLTLNRSLFDYCDLSQYTREKIAPLLSAHYVKVNYTEDGPVVANTKWAATEISKDHNSGLSTLCAGSRY